jgi:hypothetical protein
LSVHDAMNTSGRIDLVFASLILKVNKKIRQFNDQLCIVWFVKFVYTLQKFILNKFTQWSKNVVAVISLLVVRQ